MLLSGEIPHGAAHRGGHVRQRARRARQLAARWRHRSGFAIAAGFQVKPAQLDKAQAWYQRYGKWSLLLSWAPIIGDPLAIAAGMLREPLWIFVVLVGIAKMSRYLVVSALVLRWAGRRMKFTAVTFGTEGDTRPIAMLSRALMDAGHEVSLARRCRIPSGAPANSVCRTRRWPGTFAICSIRKAASPRPPRARPM